MAHRSAEKVDHGPEAADALKETEDGSARRAEERLEEAEEEDFCRRREGLGLRIPACR